jgi:carbonic anhydrase
MERRRFIKGLAFIGLCPLCATPSFAAEGVHWSYEGEHGPNHWGALGADNAACSVGSQQSPLDITNTVEAEIPAIVLDWKKGTGEIVNNGHTIQVNMPAGKKLDRGDKSYDLLQFHFHSRASTWSRAGPLPWRCISSTGTLRLEHWACSACS